MDIKQTQISSPEQKELLRFLAESVSRPGCLLLEVGSWCGDSAVILGKIAKQNGGRLFCVDWWKGNVGTQLEDIGKQVDVFAFFWDRVCREGLAETVVPVRAESAVAAEVLKSHTFDLIFLDADHRYEAINRDILLYAPLVRDQGLLVGHDCEGYLADYDLLFLKAGKDMDYYESVHCGVVLAVGEAFEEYEINCGIWSVRADRSQPGGFQKPGLDVKGISDKRQPPSPPIGICGNYYIYRYGKKLYAVPATSADADITSAGLRDDQNVIAADEKSALAEIIGHPYWQSLLPSLFETYKGFHLLQSDKAIVALNEQQLPIALETDKDGNCLNVSARQTLKNIPKIDEVKQKVDLYIIDQNQEIEQLKNEAAKQIDALQETLDQQAETIAFLKQELAASRQTTARLQDKILDQEARIQVNRFNESIKAQGY